MPRNTHFFYFFVPNCRGRGGGRGGWEGGVGGGGRIKSTREKIINISRNGVGIFLGHSLSTIKLT